jgi:hypothetical protein
MRRLLRHRPSPALVVSFVALFVALGGVSYGVATGSIDSREIKNNSILSRDIHNNGIVAYKDIIPNTVGGTRVKESSLGSVPHAYAISRWAVVNAQGTLARGRAVSSAARTAEGRYQVVFDKDLRGCSYVATIGDTSAADPPSGQISTASLASNVNGVVVRTTNAGGQPADRPFHLWVGC